MQLFRDLEVLIQKGDELMESQKTGYRFGADK